VALNKKRGGSDMLISVVLPTFNREKQLPRAIASVLSQSYRNLELIIIDDGSTDSTEEIVKGYSDARIRYYKQDLNKGGSAARNVGIKSARGEMVAFQDSDDEWLPDKLERQVRKFSEVGDDVGVIYCGYESVFERTNEVVSSSIPDEKGDVYKRMLIGCITGTLTVVVRVSCFKKAGLFDEKMQSCHDWDLWIRISKYYKFDYVPEILAKAYIHGNQLSTNLETKIKGKEKILEKYKEELIKDSSFYKRYLMGLYLQHAMTGNISKGRIYLLDVLNLYPRHLKGYVHLAFSFIIPWIYPKVLKSYYAKSRDGITYYIIN
jgi:glycosyltransferase involved in cell wall biosynthesis